MQAAGYMARATAAAALAAALLVRPAIAAAAAAQAVGRVEAEQLAKQSCVESLVREVRFEGELLKRNSERLLNKYHPVPDHLASQVARLSFFYDTPKDAAMDRALERMTDELFRPAARKVAGDDVSPGGPKLIVEYTPEKDFASEFREQCHFLRVDLDLLEEDASIGNLWVMLRRVHGALERLQGAHGSLEENILQMFNALDASLGEDPLRGERLYKKRRHLQVRERVLRERLQKRLAGLEAREETQEAARSWQEMQQTQDFSAEGKKAEEHEATVRKTIPYTTSTADNEARQPTERVPAKPRNTGEHMETLRKSAADSKDSFDFDAVGERLVGQPLSPSGRRHIADLLALLGGGDNGADRG